jgi:hypothetical protein
MTDQDTLITFLVLFSVLSILFSVFNGLVINWQQSLPVSDKATPEQYANATRLSWVWHGIGFVFHFLLVVLFAFVGGWLWAVIGFFLNWIGHNIIIAVIMGQKWYYVGKTAWFDKMIRKLLPFIKFDK